MLGEVENVGIYDRLLHDADGGHVLVGGVVGDDLGHTADVVVGAEQIGEGVVERLRKRRQLPVGLDDTTVAPLAERVEELEEGHRMEVDEVHLADRERSGRGKGYPEQGAGGGDMVLRGVLGEVLQGIQCGVARLDLVEDDQ